MLELTSKNKKAFEELFKNEKQEVLIEELVTINNKDYYRGHTKRYVLIDIPKESLPELAENETYINRIVTV